MRTAEEMARAIMIADVAELFGDPTSKIAALLAAWRDECVASALTAADAVCEDCGESIAEHHVCDTCFSSVDPLQELDKLHWQGRAERAEAERDRFKREMRFIEESMRPMARINAELEAERDKLKAALTESLMASAGRADEIVHLREEMAALQTALAWYADEGNYTLDDTGFHPIDRDGGGFACATLLRVKGGES